MAWRLVVQGMGQWPVQSERAPEVSRDRRRRSKRIVMIVVRVGRGDAGSCRHGCTEDRRSVMALVANGDGADAGRAHGTCSSSRAGELLPCGGGRTRRCASPSSWSSLSSAAGAVDVRAGAVRAACGLIAGRGSRAAGRASAACRATVDRRATGKMCRGWRSRSAQRADRHDRHRCRAW